jgi:hypothetical protein
MRDKPSNGGTDKRRRGMLPYRVTATTLEFQRWLPNGNDRRGRTLWAAGQQVGKARSRVQRPSHRNEVIDVSDVHEDLADAEGSGAERGLWDFSSFAAPSGFSGIGISVESDQRDRG